MKTLKITFISFCLFSAVNLFSQNNLTIEQTTKLADQAQLNEDNGDKAMMMFLLKQDPVSFDQAIQLYKTAISNYDTVMAKGTASSNSAGALAQYYSLSKTGLQSKMDMFGGYVHDMIKDETAKDRKKKVKYDDQEYNISSNDKIYFQILNDNIERSNKRKKA